MGGWKIWLRGGGAAGNGGERPFSGQGRLLRGLRAEVNCREGKRRKKRERGERERESYGSGQALLPSSPLPRWLTSLPLWASGSLPIKQGGWTVVPRSPQPHSTALGPQTPNRLGPQALKPLGGWLPSHVSGPWAFPALLPPNSRVPRLGS